jgi:hypothetical protein
MSHRTPLCAIAKRATALDQWIFGTADRTAVEHGWQIIRPHLLTRTYRDPRWTQDRDDGGSEPGRRS